MDNHDFFEEWREMCSDAAHVLSRFISLKETASDDVDLYRDFCLNLCVSINDYMLKIESIQNEED